MSKNYKEIGTLNVGTEFEEFKALVQPNFDTETFRNPFYYIAETDMLVKDEHLDEAKAILEKAIGANSKSIAAHVRLFEVAIESGQAVQNKLKSALKDVIFINFENKDGGKAYLETARKHLKQACDGLDEEIKYIDGNFSGDKFATVLKHGAAASKTKPKSTNFPLMQHISSRFTILTFYFDHFKELHDQLATMENAFIRSRITNYFDDPKDAAVKSSMMRSELNDLSALGLDVTYSLQEMRDVPVAVLNIARVQIAAGLAALTGSFLFPPAAYVAVNIAGTMISEGITDIIASLVNQSGENIDWQDRVKEKVMNYSIAIFTSIFDFTDISQAYKLFLIAMNIVKATENLLEQCARFKKVTAQIHDVSSTFDRGVGEVITVDGVDSLDKLAQNKDVQEFSKVLSKIFEMLDIKCDELVKSEMDRSCLVMASKWRLIEILVDMNTDGIDRFGVDFGQFLAKMIKGKKGSPEELERMIASVPVKEFCESLKIELMKENEEHDFGIYNDVKLDYTAEHIFQRVYLKVKVSLTENDEKFTAASLTLLVEAYETLGLSFGVSKKNFNDKFKELLKVHHPSVP
jgi:hypothetical protein